MPSLFDRCAVWLLVKLGILPKSAMSYSRPLPNVIGLPAAWFADEELMGANVRLEFPVSLGNGLILREGESFTVVEVRIKSLTSLRKIAVSNYRVSWAPVPVDCCALLFSWEGIPNGKKTS